MGPWALNRLAQALSRGAVIAYPTDTIWGFGCDPFNEASVARLLQIKQRPVDKGLILLSSSLLYCESLIEIDAAQRETLRKPVDQPTTWLVRASDRCPAWIRGNHDTVAIRLTDHPLLRYLCEQLYRPLVSTSANRAGRPAARNALVLRRQFAGELDAIVGGFDAGSGKPSRIKSLASGNTLRASD